MIYFDNAATSWPKPQETKDEIYKVMEKYGANPGRGAYAFAKETAEYVEHARKEIAAFLGVIPYRHLVFTESNTAAANLVIKTFLKSGDHVISMAMEHNATLRPLYEKEKEGIKVTQLPFYHNINEEIKSLEEAIQKNTSLIVVNHGSNVTGSKRPLREIISVGKKYHIPVFADMAQTAGIVDFPAAAEGLDFASYAGHKSLLGYGGIGALYVRDPKMVKPLIHGGTGSMSHLMNQPVILPQGLEAGTKNTLGIASMLGGIRYIKKKGINEIREHELELTRYFRNGVGAIKNVILYGDSSDPELPVVSINVKGLSPGEVASYLSEKGDICVRAGLHCAPNAHESIGTENYGTVRFSFGPFNRKNEVDMALNLLDVFKI